MDRDAPASDAVTESAAPPVGRTALPADGPAPGLTPASRSVLVAGVLMVHLGAVCAFLQVETLRKPEAEVAPLFVSLLPMRAAPEPAAPKSVEPRDPPQPRPRPIARSPSPVLVAAPQPTPAAEAFIAPPAPIASQPEAPPAPAAAIEAPGSRALAAVAQRSPMPTAPRAVPHPEVRYLVPPAPVYPAASRRLGESGEVHLSVEIGVDGYARHLSVQRSSGFSRLDASALVAVRAARFVPYLDGGVAVVVWTTVPVAFELSN
ncbi:MAG: TonB family protein [Burkholderiaceae bacterium]|nr:TonB family protein [Burkholderiaceae bacterium]